MMRSRPSRTRLCRQLRGQCTPVEVEGAIRDGCTLEKILMTVVMFCSAVRCAATICL